MGNIEICVVWRELELVVTVEDADYSAPGEWIPNSGYVTLDYKWVEDKPHPADEVMRMIQAQIDDEPDRFFDRIVEECADKIFEDGLVAYSEQQAGLAERYAAERDDWLYHKGKESRREFRRSF